MHNMNKVQMLDFPQHGDERGHLVIAEGMKDIPFEIKRVFYIYGSEQDVIRGRHANRKTEFVLINVCYYLVINSLSVSSSSFIILGED